MRRLMVVLMVLVVTLTFVPLPVESEEQFNITLINRTSNILDLYDICIGDNCKPSDDYFLCRATPGRSCNFTSSEGSLLLGAKVPGASKYYAMKDLWDEKSPNVTWEVW